MTSNKLEAIQTIWMNGWTGLALLFSVFAAEVSLIPIIAVPSAMAVATVFIVLSSPEDRKKTKEIARLEQRIEYLETIASHGQMNKFKY